MKKVNVIIEKASDGSFSCYTQESFLDFALFGYGDTAKEAKEDLLQAYEEIKEMLKEDGIEAEELTFVWHYDIKSFFDYFDFLNVSRVAERAGINPSLMRKYTSGLANAGEGQYVKLKAAVDAFAKELSEVTF
jgi:hypothetical protein